MTSGLDHLQISGATNRFHLNLHLFERVDAENRKALLEHFSNDVEKEQSAGANFWLRFQHRTFLVKRGEMACQIVEIIAKEIGPVFIGDGFQNESEVQKVFGERKLLGRVKQYNSRRRLSHRTR